jgi:hypothetical protein
LTFYYAPERLQLQFFQADGNTLQKLANPRLGKQYFPLRQG